MRTEGIACLVFSQPTLCGHTPVFSLLPKPAPPALLSVWGWDSFLFDVPDWSGMSGVQLSSSPESPGADGVGEGEGVCLESKANSSYAET